MHLLLPNITTKQAALVTLQRFILERHPKMEPRVAYERAVAALVKAVSVETSETLAKGA